MQKLEQKNRRTVFEGGFVRVEQWEQEMYDGKYRLFEPGFASSAFSDGSRDSRG